MIIPSALSTIFVHGTSLTDHEKYRRLEYRTVGIPDRRPQLIATVIILQLVVVAAVCTRAYTRKFIVKSKFRKDDIAIFFAMIFFVCLSVFHVLGVQDGIGRHAWDIQFQIQGLNQNYSKTILSIFFYFMASNATRISVLLFILHLNAFRSMERMIKVAIGIVVCYTIIYVIFIALRVRRGIVPEVPAMGGKRMNKHTINLDLVLLVMNLINPVTDFAVWILPVKMILQVQVSLQQKAQIVGLMCIGLIVCVASGIMVYYLFKMNSDFTDFTWHLADIAIWATIEVALGILCSCCPTIRQIWKHKRNDTGPHLGARCDNPREKSNKRNTLPQTNPMQTITRPPRIYSRSSGGSSGDLGGHNAAPAAILRVAADGS